VARRTEFVRWLCIHPRVHYVSILCTHDSRSTLSKRQTRRHTDLQSPPQRAIFCCPRALLFQESCDGMQCRQQCHFLCTVIYTYSSKYIFTCTPSRDSGVGRTPIITQTRNQHQFLSFIGVFIVGPLLTVGKKKSSWLDPCRFRKERERDDFDPTGSNCSGYRLQCIVLLRPL